MTRARKSWHEKLEKPVAGLPKVCEVPDKWVKMMGGHQIAPGKGKKPPRVVNFEKSLV